MASKPKKAKTNGRIFPEKLSTSWVVITGLVALIFFGGVYSAMFKSLNDYSDTFGKYELLELVDNQACRYLDRQPEVNGSFDLNVTALQGMPKLTYKCTTGKQIQPRAIQNKFVDGYDEGAIVRYFSTNEEAVKFAEEKMNPLRYWGVDQEGQKNGIPQTSRFTFVVTDEPTMYFDSYTVKANAVLRVSLPCAQQDPEVCHAQADGMLQREMKGINVL